MSEENNNKPATLSPSRAKAAVVTSIKNPNDKLQKDLKKHVNKAIDFLVSMLDSDEVDVKDKKDAAKFLVSSYQSVTDSCTKFALQQIVQQNIMDMKRRELTGAKDVTEESSSPKVIFSTNVYDPDKLDRDEEDVDNGDTFDANWNLKNESGSNE